MCCRSQIGMTEETSPSPSTSSSEFEKPQKIGNKFDNPKSFTNWSGLPGISAVLKWQFTEKNHENVPSDKKELDKTIPVRSLTSFTPSNNMCDLYAAWLGHATVLVHMEGANFITDPIWAKRASFLSFSGPLRYRPPPMEITNLPEIHFAVISHDHYDHLDSAAVSKINDMNPTMRWFVPLEMKKWMKSIEIENTDDNPDRVTDMNWGDEKKFTINGKEYTVHCVPAQHWGQRGPLDRNERLWSGWAIEGPTKKFYYSGDTGFCDKEFAKIGNKLGPFNLAAIPIGAYEPRWFMKSQHINPEEAIEVHQLVRSKFSIGIHWGTYHMGSYEYYLEPKEKIAEIMKKKVGISPFVTIPMGEIWEEGAETSPSATKSTESESSA